MNQRSILQMDPSINCTDALKDAIEVMRHELEDAANLIAELEKYPDCGYRGHALTVHRVGQKLAESLAHAKHPLGRAMEFALHVNVK